MAGDEHRLLPTSMPQGKSRFLLSSISPAWGRRCRWVPLRAARRSSAGEIEPLLAPRRSTWRGRPASRCTASLRLGTGTRARRYQARWRRRARVATSTSPACSKRSVPARRLRRADHVPRATKASRHVSPRSSRVSAAAMPATGAARAAERQQELPELKEQRRLGCGADSTTSWPATGMHRLGRLLRRRFLDDRHARERARPNESTAAAHAAAPEPRPGPGVLRTALRRCRGLIDRLAQGRRQRPQRQHGLDELAIPKYNAVADHGLDRSDRDRALPGAALGLNTFFRPRSRSCREEADVSALRLDELIVPDRCPCCRRRRIASVCARRWAPADRTPSVARLADAAQHGYTRCHLQARRRGAEHDDAQPLAEQGAAGGGPHLARPLRAPS